MTCRFVRMIILVLLGCITSSVVVAEESCGDILRYSARDLINVSRVSDIRKYYFEGVCRGDGKNAGFDYRDASSVIGISYSSKDDYCRNEEKFDSTTTYSSDKSSIVVRTSTDDYVKCRALVSRGIETSVTLASPGNTLVFSVGIQRVGVEPQTVETVRLNPEVVECSAKKNGKSFMLNGTINDIGYKLPQNKTYWSMSCSRKFSKDLNGNKTFEPVQMVVSTSAGDLPVSLSGIGIASENWASAIRGDLIKLSNNLNSRVDGIEIIIDRHPDYYDIDSEGGVRDCNGREVVFGFRNSRDWALDMWRCASLSLRIPQRIPF